MAKGKSTMCAVRRTQRRRWAKMLKRIKLDDLEQVTTFSDGATSFVSLVQLKGHPDSSFALKTIEKASVTNITARRNILLEKQILGQVENDFIVKLYRTFKDKKWLRLLTEYLPGGDLSNLVPIKEENARFYIACLVEALGYLHGRNIVHNDLKTENVVIDVDGYAKLIDFGLAEKLKFGELGFTVRGTIAFMPPENARPLTEGEELHIGRDRAVDLWALGIILYDLLTGQRPFVTNSDYKTACKNIIEGIESVQFPEEIFSEEAKDFIHRLCTDDPNSRLGYQKIDEIRQHRWFEGFDWKKLRNRSLTPPMVPNLESPIDTKYFYGEIECNLDEVVEDDSDWDLEF